MDAMLQALGGIVLRAVPTFLLILLFHFYLKNIFFKPLGNVLKARYEATEGARELAAQSLADAEARTAKYEKALFDAKTELYQNQEKAFEKLQEEQNAAIAEARAKAEEQVKRAKEELAGEVEQARQRLADDSEALAGRIADSILRRSAA
jgi:F-type H+-transporting ATPase subunit b